MLQISEFAYKSKKNWEAQATIDLKGENPFETLTWLSEENIDWRPIYTSEDIQDIPIHEIGAAQNRVNDQKRDLIETVYVSDNQKNNLETTIKKWAASMAQEGQTNSGKIDFNNFVSSKRSVCHRKCSA